jgi:hypothetical protein
LAGRDSRSRKGKEVKSLRGNKEDYLPFLINGDKAVDVEIHEDLCVTDAAGIH